MTAGTLRYTATVTFDIFTLNIYNDHNVNLKIRYTLLHYDLSRIWQFIGSTKNAGPENERPMRDHLDQRATDTTGK